MPKATKSRQHRRKPPKYLVIDGCPAPYDVAPYIYIVLRGAEQTASSIYRGSDPEAVRILHAHGKRTQAEIHADPELHDISNPEGESQHDLHSDGVGNPHVPPGEKIEDYSVGVDSGTNSQHDKDAIERSARKHGWHVKHPYSRGVEGHHWCFASRPHPHSLKMRARILWLRRTLPRR